MCRRRREYSNVLSIAFIFISVLLVAPLARASYLPGQTLDPSCLPTDSTCVVTSLTASSTANSFPYYAANGSVLSATSTLTILQNGNVGVGTTSPQAKLAINGSLLGTGHASLGGSAQINPSDFYWANTNNVLAVKESNNQTTGALTGIYSETQKNGPLGQVVTGVTIGTEGGAILGGSPLSWSSNDTYGGFFYGANNSTTGTANIYGVYGEAYTQAAGGITNAYGGRFFVGNYSGGTITNAYGVSVPNMTAGTNNYAFYTNQNSGTSNYALYTAGTAPSYFRGSVGIGTTSPAAKLVVWGPDTASSTAAFIVANTASTSVFSVYDGGNAILSGTLSQSSDQRLKTNVASLDASSSLAAVLALDPVSYTRLDEPGGGTNLGFLAQDVQQIFPELVTVTNPTTLTPGGTLTLNYIGLIAPIVEAVKELAGHVGNLAKSITTAVLNATTGNFTNVNTSNLCIKKSDGTNVCVTGDQLSALISSKQGGASVSSGTTSACTLTASSASITSGDRVTLSWTFPDAGTFSINQNIGSVSPALAGTTTSKAIINATDATTTVTFTGTGTPASSTGAPATCATSVSIAPSSPIVITDVIPTISATTSASSNASSTPLAVTPEATSTPPTTSDFTNTASTTLSTTTPSQNDATTTLQ